MNDALTRFVDMLTGIAAYFLSSISMQILFYVVLLIAGIGFIRQLREVLKDDKENELWWQFISSPGRDGIERGDITKLGQVVGIILGFFVIIFMAIQVHDLTWLGFLSILLAVFAYLGGVQGYQNYLRAKTIQQQNNSDKIVAEKDATEGNT